MAKKYLAFLLLSSIILLGSVSAYTGSDQINLLAVSEKPDGNFTGSIANMYLDIKPGNGRIFIDTYPFTKLDTQFTTRYAKNFACNYIGEECSYYDFFYTIKAGSTIIGGPSGGAATALLTAAMIDGKKIPKDISVTGTIGSGGIIGPVGGVKEKVIAAADAGLDKVFIPKISGINDSDIINISANYDIEIIPVSDFDELYYYVYGEKLSSDYEAIETPEFYSQIMKGISENLCTDANNSYMFLSEKSLKNSSYMQVGADFFNQSFNETVNENYYSAASFCFSAASKFESQKLLLLNDSEVLQEATALSEEYSDFSSRIKNKTLDGLIDLQAYMITMQRLTDASESIFAFNFSKEDNFSRDEIEKLAYAKVRFKSAKYWSEFLNIEKDQDFIFNEVELLNSCLSKINEVEAYLNYVRDYLQLPLASVESTLKSAYTDYYKEDYALCLFKSTRAKADAEFILSTMGVKNDDVNDLIQQKEVIARNSIGESVQDGIFPILAYSYYTYALSLSSTDEYSSLLYLEYARAMSDISIYFEKPDRQEPTLFQRIPKEYYTLFVLGFSIGGAFTGTVAILLMFIFDNKKGKRKKIPKNLKKKSVRMFR